ncbi:MAG TPA: hypothetical protein VFV58_37050 [Blastocatellia bacterium]|jgi:hypothetical protein|nr:hypothetical protein [Blastocatellia bacterium]
MNSLSIILGIACFAPSVSLQDEKSLSLLMERAEVVVVAEVIELQPSPGFWSGQFASVQHVEYRVVEVLKGEVHKNRIDAGHYLVFNSRIADKDHAQLSPELFKKGNRLALLLSREKGFGCKKDSLDAGIETFCSTGGAMVAEAERLEIIRRALKSGGRDGNK